LPASALRWAGLRVFLKHILQHRLVQAQVCNELLELAILLVQLAQTAELRHALSAVFPFPVEKHGFADVYLSTNSRDGRAAFGLTQRKRDLLFGGLGLFHGKTAFS
jgi:hypothetical protein